MSSKATNPKSGFRKNSWFERLIAILAVVNLAMVFFDLSYLQARDFYLQFVPGVVQAYDPVKGIQPHRETQKYLNKVNQLEAQVLQTGLRSPESEALLEELQLRSQRLIDENPFVNKSRVLEKIKNQMQQRVEEDSARDSFISFWSPSYLEQAGFGQEIGFFNTQVRPLIETNYYREVNKFGEFVDNFWLIDLSFILIFAIDILARTYSISRQQPQLSWFEAILRRWYDLFLLLPFWRWLRVFPVMIRLYQTKLLNLEPLRKQINYDFAVSFAEELAELIGIEAIDQMQESIQQGDVARWLFHPETRRPYVQVNQTDEVTAIATRLVNISIYDVLPQIQPDLEDLVQHSLKMTLNELPVYQQLQILPAWEQLSSEMTGNLAKNLSQNTYNFLIKALEDPVATEITNRLLTNFRDVLEAELKKKRNLQEIEALLVDMLEEIKINYVKGIAEGGLEKVREEADRLERMIYKS